MSQQPVKRPRGRPRKNPLPEQQVGVAERVAISSEQPAPTQAEERTTPAALKVHIYPSFGEEDNGDGGVRRVVEGQIAHLPQFGIEIVKTADEADVIAYHIKVPPPYIKIYPHKTFVAMCHGLYWAEYEWENWALKANAEVMEALRVADAITAPSEWVANSIRRHTSRPVSIIHHGIDFEEWNEAAKKLQPKDYVLWNKTRPDPVCDPEPLNQLAAKMPRTTFISTYGNPQSNVALTGRLSFEDAKKLIYQAGVYLCTSRETFGIGTLEAMACGVPVVGYAWGGQTEFIEHGHDGWLAAPGDVDGLAEGIRWAFANRAEIGAAASVKAASFSWDKACLQYAQLFKETYERKRTAGPRTSIIVTAYNLERYLPDTLESVAGQSDEDWECIIVEDGSPDSCGEIADSWAKRDGRFKVIHNEKNVYLAEARNIGIRAARGRYILPLDADDMLAPGAVEVLAAALDADRTVSVAYGGVLFVNEDGKTPTVYQGDNLKPGHSGWPFQFQFKHQIQKKNLLPYCSMYRKEAWQYVGGYRRRNRTAEDADFWTRLSSFGFRPRMVTEEDTLIYRNRPGSMSREQGDVDWTQWFTWSKDPELTPAGADIGSQLPIPSLDPMVISVIIPVGPGHEVFVHDAVDSVMAQTFQLWECVVVNDTGKPLPELPAWVKVIEGLDKPTNPAAARNRGIAASRGKLFLPLDADDYLMPEALQVMYDVYVETHDIVYSDFWQSSNDGKETSLHKCDDYDPNLIIGTKRMVDGILREGMMHSVTALTPKAAWARVGGYDESLPAWEDWDFQIALGNIGACSRRVSAPLFFYRKHTGFRREHNYAVFDEGKEAILRKWGQFIEGGKQLMACSSCSRKTSSSAPLQTYRSMAPPAPTSNDAVLIEYVGSKQGSQMFRGKSRTSYWFSALDSKKWVLAEDADMFLKYNDFRIAQPDPVSANSSEPSLIAAGPPQ